jgi:PAS domain S-box-containing protein
MGAGGKDGVADPARVAELVRRAAGATARRTDRLFVGLLLAQWGAAVGLALWTGSAVGTALGVGLAVVGLPVWLGLARPGRPVTRHVIAAGQMLTRPLLAHLAGGQADAQFEAYFLLFGSLAFLAFYRDWRVLLTASAVAVGENLIRGLLWPEAVYGTAAGAGWRWAGHAGWVAFVAAFLVYGTLQSAREVRATAEREAALEAARAGVEATVADRTREVEENGARFRTLLEHSTDFISVIDPAGTILYESPSVERLGYFPEDLVGRSVWALVHPDDAPAGRDRLARAVENPGAIEPLELRFRGAGGEWRVREGSCRYVPGLFGAGAAVVNTRDVTDRERAARRARLQHDAARILADAGTARDAILGVVEAACAATGWEVGEFWEPAPDRPALVFAGGWHAPEVAEFAEASAGMEFPRGAGLPGLVWATKTPRVARDLSADPDFLRPGAAAAAGLRSAVALPILLDGRVVGVFDFLTRRADPPAPDEVELLEGLGGQMAQCLERKRAEAALRESEERFKAFINNSPVAAFMKDEAGRYTYVNEPVVRRFGKPAEFWLGRTDEELFPGGHSAAWRENDRAVLAGGKVVEFAESVPLEGGGVSHWTTYKFPFRDAAGRVYLAGIGLDVTEKKGAEDALRESEEKFRAVVEDLAEGMLLLDPDTLRVLQANPAAGRMFGYPPAELVGLALYDLCAHDRASVDANRERVARSGRLAAHRRKYRHRDGSLLDLDLSASLIRHGGRPLHAVVFRDVGEQVRAEAALRESEERFRGAIEHAPIGMALVAPDGRFLRVNPALCGILGYEPGELLARTFQDLTHPDDLAADLAQAARLLAGEIPTYQLEKRYRHKAGHAVWTLLGVSAVRDAAGGPLYFVSQVQDITARREAEEERDRLFTQSLNLLMVGGYDGRFERVNPAWEGTLGYTPAELLARPFMELVHPDDAAATEAEVRRLAAGGTTRAFENRVLHEDGSYRSMVWSATPYREGRTFYASGQDITDRKRAEEALRESENRFRLMADGAPVVIWLGHPDQGGCTFVNRTGLELWGRPLAELLGFGWVETVHPDDWPRVEEAYRRGFAARAPVEAEYRIRRADGEYRWMADRGVPRFLPDGTFAGYIGSMTDVTDRRRAEEEARERDQRFRAIFDSTFQYIGLLSPDGTLLEANRTALAAPGAAPDQVIGRPFWECVWWSHNPALQARLREAVRAAAGGRFDRFEATHPLATGELATIDFSVTPVRDESGAVVLLVPEGRDISYVKRAEDEARRTRAQLEDAIECLDAGFVMYDAADRLVTCNGPYRHMYPDLAPLLVPGTSYEEIVRHGYRAGLYTTGGRSEDEAVAARVAGHRDPGPAKEIRAGDRWLRVSTRRTGEGGFVSLRTDITALKRAREEAEAASRAKGEFLANMSHEIRTPMNGIMGLTDLVLETDLSAEQRESLSLVKSSAEALLTVINDILDFSKIEAGKMDLDPTPFRLRDAVGDTLKAMALKAHAKGLELTCDVRPDVPDALVGDAGRLRQVLTNLIGNAVKFTATGEVSVRAERVPEPGDGVRVRFAVADTGIGIPRAAQAAVFDAFTQADGSTTRKYGGTGLGLTICARLVGLMGGTIGVESEPGKGSTFAFDVRFTRASPSAAKSGFFPPADLRGLSVLVVDDNPTNRRVLTETLQLWAVRATATESGPAALAELRRAAAAGEPYPLVLLDAMMPEMDGFAVAEQIGREPALAAPVVMMLSSADRGEDAARCRALGMAGYLVKPVKPDDLRRALAAVVGTRAEAARAAQPAPPAPPPQDGRPLHVLLAEDNAVNQRVAVRILQGCGHRVTVANHGGEAVRLSAGEPFDVILMDVQMPVMDGFEATATIRAREAGAGRRTPIVAMTAHAMKGDRERCLAAGMDDYLSKPVRRDELVGILNRIGSEAMAATPPPGPAETPPPAGPPVFDRAAALARLGGDEPLLAELAGLFREEGPRMIAEIRDALAAGDAVGVRRSAHGLKGSAGYVGAARAVEAARRLELIGEAGDLAPAPDALRALEVEIEQLTAALAGFAPATA